MSFIADKQTLEDLNLLGKYKPHSVYGLFNAKVHTTGGERLLEEMFKQPLSDDEEINRRSKTFQYFEHKELTFPFVKDQLDLMEDYLAGGSGGNPLSALSGVLHKKIWSDLFRDEAYGILYAGLLMATGVLITLADVLDKLDEESPYSSQILPLKVILDDRRLVALRAERGGMPLPLRKIAGYDHLLRHVLREEMEQIMRGIYQLDVHIAVGHVARDRGFSYAWALPAKIHTLSAVAVSHPGIYGAVENPVSLTRNSNMLFLTGANMAGKSTFMKSFGIAVYLAHMGFPVAAKEMVFSVRDGIYSSINVPDNLSLGYSHFYAEVLRVKTVAQEVSKGKNLVVIFDELFKGTNVKDAYDATLAVTAAFAEYRNCFFIISTHIVEVGEVLRRTNDNLQFAYLPTVMQGTIPR